MEPVKFDILMSDKTREAWQAVQAGARQTGTAVAEVTGAFKARMKEQSDVVKKVAADIQALEKQVQKAAPGKQKMALMADLSTAKRVLAEEKGALTELERQFEATAQKEVMLRTQIAQQKQLMAGMAEGTKEYAAAMQRLGELQDRYGDISTQARIHSDDNKNIKGAMDAISGLTGAMTAGVGVASLFGAEQEKLTQIQTKLQAVMAVTMGIQQVANTLNKDSFFTHTLLAGAKMKWASAQTYLNTQLGIGVGLSKALMFSGIGILLAGVGTLIAMYGSWSSKNKELAASQKHMEEVTRSASNGMGEQVLKLRRLQAEWNRLGNDLNKKQSFIRNNKEEFHSLGISVDRVSDAEVAFVKNTNAVIQAMKLRTKASVAQKFAAEYYEKSYKGQMAADERRNAPLRKEDFPVKSITMNTSAGAITQQVVDYSDIATAEKNREKAAKKMEIAYKTQEVLAERHLQKMLSLQSGADKVLRDVGLTPYKETREREEDKAASFSDSISDAELKARQKIESMRLQIMKEGAEKRRAEARAQYRQELDTINNEEREKLALLKKAQKEGYTVTPGQTASIKNLYGSQRELAAQIYAKQLADIDKESLDELQKKYRDHAAQRLEIEKGYDKEIRELIAARNRAEAEGKEQLAEDINRNIAKATSDKGKELMAFDFERLKESPEYVRAFEDLKNTSSETLTSLLEQLERAKATAARVLAPDELREYTTTMRELMDELLERDPFGALAERMRQMKQAEEELSRARVDLEVIRSGGKVVAGTRFDPQSGKIVKSYLTLSEALERYNRAKDRAIRANNDLLKSEEKITGQLGGLLGVVKELGGALGGSAGEILGYVADVGTFATGTVRGLKEVAKVGDGALSTLDKASVILGVVSTGIQLMQQLDSILPTADNKYERYAAKVAEINKLTDAVNEYRIAAITARQAEESWFSGDNLRNLRNYKELHDQIAQAYRDKAGEAQAIYQNKSGGGWLTNSVNWVLDNTYGKIYGIDFARQYREGTTAAVNNLRIETRRRKRGWLGSGIGGRSQQTEDLQTWINRQEGWGNERLFDERGLLNKELAQSVINQYGDKLVGQTKETLEALIKLREQYDEYKKQLREYVSSLYEPLADNMVNALWDWLDTGKDALDGFKEYAGDTFRAIVTDMMKTIVLEKVIGGFKDDIAEVYERYASGVIDVQELMRQVTGRVNELKGSYASQLPVLQDILSSVSSGLKDIGVDLSASQSSAGQSGRVGSYATLSQEQGTKLEGLFTSVQDHVSSIDEKMDGFDAAISRALEILGMIAFNTGYCRLLEDVVYYLEKTDRNGVKISD